MIKAENFRQASHMGFFSAIKFMVLVKFNAYKTSIAQMIRQIFSPILYFIFLAQGLGALIPTVTFMGEKVNYKTYVFLGIFAYILVTAFSESIYRTTVDKRYGLLALKLQGGIKPFYYVFCGGIFMEISILIQCLILLVVAMLFGVRVSFPLYLLGILFAIISMYFWRSLAVLISIGIKDYRT